MTAFQFIPWKKKYFRLKSRDANCEDEMTELLDQKGLLELDFFPLNLARYMYGQIYMVKITKNIK